MRIRRAQPHELDTVVRLREEMKAELGRRGLDQWQSDWPDRDTMLAGFRADVEAGHTWFAEHEGQVVGMATINTSTAPGLWTEDETADALFIHRLTRAVDAPVRGVGQILLNHAEQLAIEAGRSWLRLDAWTTNRDLHDYYRRMGFRFVGIVDHHSPSAALFERPVRKAERGCDTPNVQMPDMHVATRKAAAPQE